MTLGCPGSRRYAPAFRGKPAVARVDCLNSPRRYICIRCNASYYALTRCTVTDMACRPPGPKASHCLWEPDLVLNGLKRALSFEHCAPLGPPVRRRTACCDAVQHVATRYTMLQRSTTCCKRSTTCPCSHSPMRTSAREAQPAYARLRNDRSAGYHAAEIDVKVEGYHVRRIPCSISHGWRVKAGSVTVVTAFCTVWN
jgi:hypothetical protein